MKNKIDRNEQQDNEQKKSIGRCNICGEQAKLTEDHVPPKFWNNSKIKFFSQGFGTMDPPRANMPYPQQARKGIVFRTLCEKCNNDLLGDKTDKHLKEFIDIIKTGAPIRRYSHFLNCNVYVNRVARAVTGHILAAKNSYDDWSNITYSDAVGSISDFVHSGDYFTLSNDSECKNTSNGNLKTCAER